MERSGETIRKLSKLKFSTFQGIVSKWEINNEPLPTPSTTSTDATGGSEGVGGGGNGNGAMSE